MARIMYTNPCIQKLPNCLNNLIKVCFCINYTWHCENRNKTKQKQTIKQTNKEQKMDLKTKNTFKMCPKYQRPVLVE